MKTITALLAALCALGPATAGTGRAGELDFRRAGWGMSKEQVRASETEAEFFGETGEILIFRGEIAGAGTRILYVFRDGALERGVYAFEGTDGERVIEDYRAVLSFLIGLHGGDYELELNAAPGGTVDPDDLEALRELVLAGAADPVTAWRTDRSDIYLRLTNKDGRAAIEVHYLRRPPVR